MKLLCQTEANVGIPLSPQNKRRPDDESHPVFVYSELHLRAFQLSPEGKDAGK